MASAGTKTGRPTAGFAPLTALAFESPVLAALAVSWLILAAPPLVYGRTVKGPTVAVEQAQPAVVDATAPSEPKPAVELRRRRYDLNLLVPVPAQVLGGMFVVKGDFFKEQRTTSGPGALPLDNDIKNPNVAAIGTVYLPHAKEGAPRFFALATRYSDMSVERQSRPMAEFVVGADVAAEDMPFKLVFGATDDAESRVLVRYRSFPGFHRWLLLVGHRIERVSGWSFDATIPSHVLVGWQTQDAAWKLYSGVRWVGREYPFSTTTADGWMEGHVTSYLAGVRREVAKPIYVALEAGMQQEALAYFDERGDELSRHVTRLSPYAKVALETWISTL